MPWATSCSTANVLAKLYRGKPGMQSWPIRRDVRPESRWLVFQPTTNLEGTMRSVSPLCYCCCWLHQICWCLCPFHRYCLHCHCRQPQNPAWNPHPLHWQSHWPPPKKTQQIRNNSHSMPFKINHVIDTKIWGQWLVMGLKDWSIRPLFSMGLINEWRMIY